MKESLLKLQPGDAIQLQFPDDETKRFYVKLIGYLPDHSIIVTTPHVNGKITIIKQDQKFVVRLLTGNTVCGFSSRLLHSSARPYPHLHISYPEELVTSIVRKAQRLSFDWIVVVQNEEPGKAFYILETAIIADISTCGALIKSDRPIGEKGDILTLSTKLVVGDVEHTLTLPSIIRRAEAEDDNLKEKKHSYGIEFLLTNETDKLILHGFVYEQIAKEHMGNQEEAG